MEDEAGVVDAASVALEVAGELGPEFPISGIGSGSLGLMDLRVVSSRREMGVENALFHTAPLSGIFFGFTRIRQS